MKRLVFLVETFGLYGTALFLVWGVRHGWGGMAGQAWWLIPFTWIVAACLPGLWASRNWLTLHAFFGHPTVVLREVIRLSLLIFPAFGIGYLLYFGSEIPPATGFLLQDEWFKMALYQLLYVGLSEELFFRGYLQQRLDKVFGCPYRLFGARCGFGLIGANLLFAIGHGVVGGRLEHLDVFLPGLFFGWLQAKTGAVLAPVLFHGLSNIVLFTLRDWVQ